MLVLAAAVEEEARHTLWIDDVRLVVGARHCMSLERLYRVAVVKNMRCKGATVAFVPGYVNPDIDGQWQSMTKDEYEQYLDFHTEKFRRHHMVELKLKGVKEVPLLYCVAGCIHDGTRKARKRGQLLAPALFNVFHLRVGAQPITLLVLCKPIKPTRKWNFRINSVTTVR